MATSRSKSSTDTPDETRLDTDVTKPATTAPGDAPADTTDPTERASTRVPQPGDEAAAVGTVNAVVPVESVKADDGDDSDDEFEEYEALKPDNKTTVRVRRNLRTGESVLI
jgi:hypothetical protein